MKSLPRISLVTPSFNQGEYIEETILSVLNQGYENLQYIVIDGGSTDNTLDILKKYDDQIDYWVSEPDEGQSHAINKGLKRVDGDVFNWLNSDDMLAQGALSTIGEAFKDPALEILCGVEHDFVGDVNNVRNKAQSKYSEDSLVQTLEIGHNVQPATFFRMDRVRELEPLSTQLHFVMDMEWWWKYFLKHGAQNVAKTDTLLAYFRLHDSSKTVSVQGMFAKDVARMLSSIAHQLDTDPFFKELAPLLHKYFGTPVYSFDGEVNNIEVTEWYSVFFTRLVKVARQIHHKPDFEFGHHFSRICLSNQDRLMLSSEDIEELERIRSKTISGSWNLFRVRRKLQWILGNKRW